ncbi:MAG: sigma-70 family RNA polymerase sigma factor [Fimbriimonadaceae bacterium]|nr:sigma-70 family RNA polymerase sigma factor [Fimbriimonadaceae bacterium]
MKRTAADDQVLIQRAQAGDRGAFDQLVEAHIDRAYQYAYRLARNSDEASDIVAEAFVRVHSALKNFRGQSAFGTWLYRIITNCALDRRKRDKSGRNVSIDSNINAQGQETVREIEDDAPTPDVEAERNARETAITEALQHLPEYQKAMLIMYHVEALSYEEIAEALDLPIGTVKSRLNRARMALRQQLSGQTELFQLG